MGLEGGGNDSTSIGRFTGKVLSTTHSRLSADLNFSTFIYDEYFQEEMGLNISLLFSLQLGGSDSLHKAFLEF